MRLPTLIMMAVTGTGSWAAQAGSTEARSVSVCMSGDPRVPPVRGVETAISKIFSSIDLRIDWHNGTCPASEDAIQVTFADKVPAGISTSAMAYAMPYEGKQIVVFYERVERQGPPQRLLPYVLAHEIAHILEGVRHHSATGIMKAQWGGEDYFAMAHKTLVFASDDVKSIQHGADLRAALESR